MDVRGFVPSRFKIVRSIGGGATGDVYEAIDRERDARVALKALRNLQAHAVTRFKREFRALQDVDHPNLVAMNELIEERGELFLTMEMVDGVDFLTWVVADPARLRPALIELCRGLGALHARGKIHRDVKPSNVLVTAEGRVVVLDFGLLADAEQGDTWTGQAIVGTPQYMAPEQAAGQPPGPAADWYAVGVMLFEALTGRLPYEGPLMKILLDKQRDEPPDPEGLAPGAPPELLALCRSLLRFDPDQRPTGGAILRRLGRAPTGRPVPAAATSLSMTQSAPFVGRDAELAVLADALAACSAHDRPEAVLIEGSSGVGKTTLMRAFSRGLDDGVAVLSGRCYERESVSYKAFDGVLEDVARLLSRLEPADAAAMLPLHAAQLAQVFPALKRVKAFADAPPSRGAPVDSRELRDRVFGALRELLIRLARGRRIVLALDDLQWADEDSLALLAELLRPPEAPPLLLAATMRPPADGHAAAAQRIREVCPQVRTIALGPLDDAAARELAQLLVAVHGLTGAVDLDLLSREAAGHPLLLDELVRHAADAGAAPGAALRLEDAVAARVDALEPEARRLAELVAFAGHPLYQETLARAADVAPERVGRLVSALRLANLVRTGGARAALTVEPYHDRVRAAIAARLASDTHAELHRVLAVAIEGSPQPGQEAILAFHWQGAGRADVAAVHAARAGTRARDALAFDQAARALRWALDLGHPDRADLLARLGDTLGNAGRGAEAADAYVAAAEAVDADAEALELRRLAAEQLLISGHIDRGLELSAAVLAEVGMKLPATPGSALASLLLRRARLRLRGMRFHERHESAVAATELTRIDLCWSVSTGLAMVDTIRGADFQTRHMLLALAAGEPTRVAKALAVEGGFLSTAGPAGQRRARRVFDVAHALLARTPSQHAHALLLGAECIAAYQGGQWRRALELARESEHAIRHQRGSTGAAWQLDTVHFFWLYALYYLGQLDELARLTPEMLRAARERGDLYAATNVQVGVCNSAWLVRDDVAEARRHLDDAVRSWTVRDFHVQHYHQLLGAGQLALYTGDATAGHAALVARWPEMKRSQLLRVELVRREAVLLRARLALAAAQLAPGARERAALLRAADRDAADIGRAREPYARGLAGLVRGGVAATRGDLDRAVAELRAAAEQLDAAEMTIISAVARGRLGALIGGDEGTALQAAMAAAFADQHVVDPVRFAAMLAPGFA